MKLIIVESPGKIKKIQSVLGKDYIVDASIGHVMDIPADKMNIDIDNNFEPLYAIKDNYAKKIKELKEHIKKVDQIILAMDADREGEAIADGLVNALKLKKGTYCRVTFIEITKKAIINGIKKARDIDYDLVYAQRARRVLDKYIGYSLSPCLWNAIMPRLSAGRVQSVVGRIIVDKECEIEEFFKGDAASIFKTKGIFVKNKLELASVLIDGGKLVNYDLAYAFLGMCALPTTFFVIDKIFDKIGYRKPSAPFITSTLQQEASAKYGFSIKMTMQIAQSLYEKGYITYMRTDSTALSDDIMNEIKEFVENKWGNEYYNATVYKSKVKNAQEAHEAIRPTHIENENINGTSQEQKLYTLIWKRTVASQMAPAKINTRHIHIMIDAKKNKDGFYFETKMEQIVFLGFLKLYDIENDNINNVDDKLVGTKIDFKQIQSKQDYNKPPTRFTEALMVKYLEKNGIGRPSTYVAMIDKVVTKQYAETKNIAGVTKDAVILTLGDTKKIDDQKVKLIIGKEENRLVPTELGRNIVRYLVDKFGQIMDYKFTAIMENKFDDVSNGKLVWYTILNELHETFGSQVDTELGSKYKDNNNSDPNKRILGGDPEIFATIGKYGPYVKLSGTKKTAPIKEPLTIETITLDDAIGLLKYPYDLGKYDKKMITVKKGSYGTYIVWNEIKMSIDPNNITFENACELLKKSKGTMIGSKKEVYTILDGQYGPYVNIKKNKKTSNVSLKNFDMEDISVEKLEEHIKKMLAKPKVVYKKKE